MLTNNADPQFQAACDLLSIDPTMSLDQARRCYLRAIKLFRPERDPEGFRQRREAWEYLEPRFYLAQMADPDLSVTPPIAKGAGETDNTHPSQIDPLPEPNPLVEPEPLPQTAATETITEAENDSAQGKYVDLEAVWASSRQAYDSELMRVVAFLLSGEFPFNEINFDSLLNCAIRSKLDNADQALAVAEYMNQVATRFRREIQGMELSFKKFMLVNDYVSTYTAGRIYAFIGTELLAYRAGADNTQAAQTTRPPNFGQGEVEALANRSASLHAYLANRYEFYKETKGWNLLEATLQSSQSAPKTSWLPVLSNRALLILVIGLFIGGLRLCTYINSGSSYGSSSSSSTRHQLEKAQLEKLQKLQSEFKMPNSYRNNSTDPTQGDNND